MCRGRYAAGVGIHGLLPGDHPGRAHAAQGDEAACDRALGQAIEHFSRIDSTSRTPWGAFLDETSLAAKQGQAHYTLALTGRDQRAADRAVSFFTGQRPLPFGDRLVALPISLLWAGAAPPPTP